MYVPVGQCETPVLLAEPLCETLFFAGEATEVKLSGTVGGAMISGARAPASPASRRRTLPTPVRSSYSLTVNFTSALCASPRSGVAVTVTLWLPVGASLAAVTVSLTV